jgi:hypothetical protein
MYFHSGFHAVGGSFPMFVSQPNYTNDEINDVAYLRSLEVLFSFQKHYTESDSSSSRRGLWRRLYSGIMLRASGSSLQVLQNNPLPPSSVYVEKCGSSATPVIATRLHAQENGPHYIKDFSRHVPGQGVLRDNEALGSQPLRGLMVFVLFVKKDLKSTALVFRRCRDLNIWT